MTFVLRWLAEGTANLPLYKRSRPLRRVKASELVVAISL